MITHAYKVYQIDEFGKTTLQQSLNPPHLLDVPIVERLRKIWHSFEHPRFIRSLSTQG